MTQRRVIEILLERYGTTAVVNGRETAALIQPLQRSSGFAREFSADIGMYFLYTGPAGLPLEAGQQVAAANQSYTVLRAGAFSACGTDIYRWAILCLLAPEERVGITLQAGEVIMARADFCTEKAVQQCRPVTAWGEREPACVKPGAVQYEIALRGIHPQAGADMQALADFTVTLKQNGEQTVYSGCRWKNVGESRGTVSKPSQTMELTAAKRLREKEVVSNG